MDSTYYTFLSLIFSFESIPKIIKKPLFNDYYNIVCESDLKSKVGIIIYYISSNVIVFDKK